MTCLMGAEHHLLEQGTLEGIKLEDEGCYEERVNIFLKRS